jgi:hypothetical protein
LKVPFLSELGSGVSLKHVELTDFETEEIFVTLPSGSKAKVTRLKNHDFPKNALVFCHGYRPQGIPLAAPFAANDNPHKRVYLELMRERSFLVASISYRREGVIYADAVEDVMEMRKWIADFGIRGQIVVQVVYRLPQTNKNRVQKLTFVFVNSGSLNGWRGVYSLE